MASLSFLPNSSGRQRVSLAHIDAVVSMRLGPTRGLGKSQPSCFNRQVAMYLASHIGRWSTTVIGRFYGGRDHSTVVHSIQRIEALREADPNLDVLLCDLKSRICLVEAREESPKSRLTTSTPGKEQLELRLLANEITSQIRDLLREELRQTEHQPHAGTNSPFRGEPKL